MSAPPFIGTAGWSLPRQVQHRMPEGESHLHRYARTFHGAEINASFYKPLRRALYAKWATAVPDSFRFSVKVPKTITHENRLVDCEELLAVFLDDVLEGLGDKLGCLLVQLPPSFEFETSLVSAFLEPLRALHDGPVVLEPRHRSWFDGAADALLADYHVSRVAADPAIVPAAEVVGGAKTVAYYRLHGSPRIYWSSYDVTFINALAGRIELDIRTHDAVWCIFDNTASGSALPNALDLAAQVHR